MPLLFLGVLSLFGFGATAASATADTSAGGFGDTLSDAIDAGFNNVLKLLLLPVLLLVIVIAGAYALTRIGFFEQVSRAVRDVAEAVGLRELWRALPWAR